MTTPPASPRPPSSACSRSGAPSLLAGPRPRRAPAGRPASRRPATRAPTGQSARRHRQPHLPGRMVAEHRQASMARSARDRSPASGPLLFVDPAAMTTTMPRVLPSQPTTGKTARRLGDGRWSSSRTADKLELVRSDRRHRLSPVPMRATRRRCRDPTDRRRRSSTSVEALMSWLETGPDPRHDHVVESTVVLRTTQSRSGLPGHLPETDRVQPRHLGPGGADSLVVGTIHYGERRLFERPVAPRRATGDVTTCRPSRPVPG